MVDLSQIELATEEDKAYQIDYWARLFKAKTWEDLRMFAEKNEYLQEAAQSVYVANADEIIRQKCEARQEAERHERTMKRDMAKLREEKQALEKHNTDLEDNNQKFQEKLAAMTAYIAELEAKSKDTDN